MRSLAVTVCATRSYTYALVAQARRMQAAILQCPGLSGGHVILVGDNCREMQQTEKLYGTLLPEGWSVRRIVGPFTDGLKNYKNPAQLVIARMRSAAFTEARKLKADLCLSMDSDVLPQAHALECMVQMLDFSGGYYSVTTCPYPSQGGGDFLFGRGTPQNPILHDVYDDERIIPLKLRTRIVAHSEWLKRLQGKPDAAWSKEHGKIAAAIKSCASKGDVFFLNSRTGVLPFAAAIKEVIAGQLPKGSKLSAQMTKAIDDELSANWRPGGFRQRGWGSAAYPAIGKGAVVPTDWCGFGCTLMAQKALALAQFDGYDGSGTEDLYVVWKRWHREGLLIGAIPHAPCDHVIRNPAWKAARKQPPNRKQAKPAEPKYLLLQAHHERHHAPCVGHLRIERRAWFQQTDGEAFS